MNHYVTVNNPRIGTNHSSHAERSLAISLLSNINYIIIGTLDLYIGFFVCGVLISVKSKYGSGCGSSPGLMIFNIRRQPVRLVGRPLEGVNGEGEVGGGGVTSGSSPSNEENSFIGKKGWAVNSIVICF